MSQPAATQPANWETTKLTELIDPVQGMFVFEEYEKEVAHQISLTNSQSLPQHQQDHTNMDIDNIDQWILSGVKKVFEPKTKTKT